MPFLSSICPLCKRTRFFLSESCKRFFAECPSQRPKLGTAIPDACSLSQSALTTAVQKTMSVPSMRAGRSAKQTLRRPSSDSESHHSQKSMRASATHLRSLPVARAIAKTSGFFDNPFCRGIQSPAMSQSLPDAHRVPG